MLWLKCIGMFLVFGGCGSLGWMKTAALRRRISILREMDQGLCLFKSLTGTYRLPLNIVFSRISAQSKSSVSVFFEKLAENFKCQQEPAGELVWRQTAETMTEDFTKEDIELFVGLGNFIGLQDVTIQADAVDDCIRRIRERIKQLESERPEKEKLYQVVSLTVGGFLVIMLF